jgi:cation diffusion facilitator family transporter
VAEEAESGDGAGESTLTVLVALGANAGIAVAKGVAAVLTGSAAMAAETAHSVADTGNEVLLLTALRRSDRPADRRHPLGYGRERYFWTLLAAVSIFVSGAVFSAYEGVRALLGDEGELTSPLVSYVVLGVAFVLEGISWVRALRQVRSEARAERLSVRRLLRASDDPTMTTVFYEDSAALVGLLVAAAGIGLHELTGSTLPDAVARLVIAAVLAWVAFELARTNRHLLIGSQADPRLVRGVARWLADQPDVDAVVDLITQRTGTDRVLVCARLDLADDLDAAAVEHRVLEMDEELRRAFADVHEVFLSPVPRHDEELRARVRRRYGDEVASRLGGAAD